MLFQHFVCDVCITFGDNDILLLHTWLNGVIVVDKNGTYMRSEWTWPLTFSDQVILDAKWPFLNVKKLTVHYGLPSSISKISKTVQNGQPKNLKPLAIIMEALNNHHVVFIVFKL